MRKTPIHAVVLWALSVLSSALPSYGEAPAAPKAAEASSNGAIGVAVKVSSLGPGAEVAVQVARHFNVRAGANVFSYNDNFRQDGVNYSGNLKFRSAEAHLDWFPWARAFHVSPGVIFYNGNEVTANARVPPSQAFTLNNTSYSSGATDPITGSGKVTFVRVAPTLLAGWGNILPRSGRHFSVPFEFGVAFMGTPKSSLSFKGQACDPSGVYCVDAATDPTVRTNVAAQQKIINDDLELIRFYPIVSIGFSFRF
jgi:hypothetical protein